MPEQVAEERLNFTEHTTRRLLSMIAASGLKPGEAFATEAELEKKLKVSRPILREAISRLRALGFLHSRQYVGLTIAKPDPVGLFERALTSFVLDDIDLKQLAEMRYALELGAIDLAVRRAEEPQIERLRELAEEYAQTMREKKPGRPQDDIELDFHGTMLEATHNPMLVRMNKVLAAFFSRVPREHPRWESLTHEKKSATEHRRIAQAFRDRRADKARSCLAEHLSGLIGEETWQRRERR